MHAFAGGKNEDNQDASAERSAAEQRQAEPGSLPQELQNKLQQAGSVFSELLRAFANLLVASAQHRAGEPGGITSPSENLVGQLHQQLKELGAKLDAMEKHLVSSGEGGQLDQAIQSIHKRVIAAVAEALKPQLDQHSRQVQEAVRQPLESLGEQIEQLKTNRAFDDLLQRFNSVDNAVKEVDKAVKGLAEKYNSESENLGRAYRNLIEKNEEALTKAKEALAQYQTLVEPLQRWNNYLKSQEAQAAAAARKPTVSPDLLRALLGQRLAEDPQLEAERERLFRDLLSGNGAARALLGTLLVFWSSPPEKMPTLLKDVGEAYYRWQPKKLGQHDKFEETLARCLQRSCQEAGISNTIELVVPGQRFDSNRHVSEQRGVEITEVRGWVVLRNDGKVYSKALVGVR
jgi:uncharacterized protein YoxC